MADWVYWLIAAGVLTLAETSSMALVLVMAGGGSAAGAAAAALGAPVWLQFVVAIAVTVALLAGVRPVVRRHLTPGTGAVTGPDALVGRAAVALARTDTFTGRVRLNGAEWSARTLDGAPAVEAGAQVRVVEISGATAVVVGETVFLGPDDKPHLQNGSQS